jgi:lycopene cyclase domain-containing protein
MREYSVAAFVVLLGALGLAGARGLLGDRALWLGLLAFASLTVVADVVLTGVGIYHYDSRFDSGLTLGRMPIEDLAYGLALYLVAVTAWNWRSARVR